MISPWFVFLSYNNNVYIYLEYTIVLGALNADIMIGTTRIIQPIFPWLCFLIAIVAVVNSQDLGFGPKLKCYQCNSHTQPSCADPFDNRTFILEPCQDNGQNYSRCMKKIVECRS